MAATVSDSSTPDDGRQPGAPERLETRDVTALLEIMAMLATHRNDTRRWRFELLTQLMKLLPAAGAGAFTVAVDAELKVSRVASIFNAGFKVAAEHQAFQDEFNDAPFQDPFSIKAMAGLFAGTANTFTAARRDLVDDATWYRSPMVEQYRRAANVDDCIFSMQRSPREEPEESRQVMVLCVFRHWGHPIRFSERDRLVVDTLHQGLAWMYRVDVMLARLTRATALTPRLRQTLDLVLAGGTEREVAGKMKLSIHTVHDYVKTLYAHFGVSSRGELMARWIQSGEALPSERKSGG